MDYRIYLLSDVGRIVSPGVEVCLSGDEMAVEFAVNMNCCYDKDIWCVTRRVGKVLSIEQTKGGYSA